eukprot:CAMPEP_0173223000 /NCGR_PEP_ID=MMETSP1142-20121109/3552_1 /TAXON_ID=483371 /ORGANISM="non described non described, Strain CCMP2298" /LENGTH=217 /DNA_ID=CAMNT_0014151131 /DNA_START=3 /DNA_END=651 /DNA_ORIENTATION=+
MIDSDSDQDANHTPQNAEAESQQHNAMSAGGGADVGGPPEAGEQLHLLRPDAFDLQENFIWEKNVLVIDEVEEMIRLTVGGGVNRNKWRNRLVESMYQLACSLAWQEVASQETRTDKVSLHRLLATAFEGVVANYHLKAYPREHFFLHFPERNWPTDFLAKVAEERGKAAYLGLAAQARPRGVAPPAGVARGSMMWLPRVALSSSAASTLPCAENEG